MQQDEIMLKVENVSKVYRLGEIGGTTLRESLQRTMAKILKREDPTKKIGAKNYNKGEKFKALDNISFEVKKGERIGIIGHNGAGKSTLLKLISRVTGPTEGQIYLNGRIASMLEVGTGFHPELTGRENIYMNGAILGMTKKEIDAKMEDIIEFSEVRQFIDTPVKRYSSGMYVKLAFSVAAHLNSEIMIMDEVLAVGDVQFQNKCIEKMHDVSVCDSRTILYVSHNMNTIRKLCDRVIVLSHGSIIFDGDVEDGIDTYFGIKANEYPSSYDLFNSQRMSMDFGKLVRLINFEFLKCEEAIFDMACPIEFKITIQCNEDISGIELYFCIKNNSDNPIGLTQSFDLSNIIFKKNKSYSLRCSLDCSNLSEGEYRFRPDIFMKSKNGSVVTLDHSYQTIVFKLLDTKPRGIKWYNWYGSIKLNDIICLSVNDYLDDN